MSHRPISKLDPHKRYLQIALNSTLEDAQKIIKQLPSHDRILLEVGTPLIKKYGQDAITKISSWYKQRQVLTGFGQQTQSLSFSTLAFEILKNVQHTNRARTIADTLSLPQPYIVADLKTMDRASTEVIIAAEAGASAAVALGTASIETLDAFITTCKDHNIDPIIDMMNVEFPLAVLRKLKKIPPIVLLHRGVDEEKFNKEKQIPYHEIQRIKGNYNIMIAIAGGDTVREVQRSFFNGADIVVVWKSVYESNDQTVSLINDFVKEIR